MEVLIKRLYQFLLDLGLENSDFYSFLKFSSKISTKNVSSEFHCAQPIWFVNTKLGSHEKLEQEL